MWRRTLQVKAVLSLRVQRNFGHELAIQTDNGSCDRCVGLCSNCGMIADEGGNYVKLQYCVLKKILSNSKTCFVHLINWLVTRGSWASKFVVYGCKDRLDARLGCSLSLSYRLQFLPNHLFSGHRDKSSQSVNLTTHGYTTTRCLSARKRVLHTLGCP
jgi:hypothetical protein